MSKAALPLCMNIQKLVDTHGMNRIVFATFTFEKKCYDPKEAQKHWNSLRTNFLADWIVNGVVVIEPHADGSIHYHACLVLPFEFDYTPASIADIKRGEYRTTDKKLRQFWKLMRDVLPNFGFGRSQFIPWVGEKSMARYMTKYFTKTRKDLHIDEERKAQWKGIRLVRYLGNNKKEKTVLSAANMEQIKVPPQFGWRVASCRYSWIQGGKKWRDKLKQFSFVFGVKDFEGIRDIVIPYCDWLNWYRFDHNPCKWAYYIMKYEIDVMDVYYFADLMKKHKLACK